MDGGDSMQGSDERTAERLMDDYLKSLGLQRKRIAKDGSCLFRAVAEQVLHSQNLHTEVRAQCVKFLKKNRLSYEAFIEGDFEDYLCKLQDPQWVGEVEINALAVMYKRDFLIYQDPGKPPVDITDNNFKDKVQLCFLNGNHYDSVYPISHIKSAAVCQSILYELLYNGVFKVERGAMASFCQRRSQPNDVLSDDSMPACMSSDESELDPAEAIRVENETTSRHSYKGRGRVQVSARVKRSLNPTLYRNVEYDVWHRTKKAQQKLDYCIAAGMHYTVGDRCQVRLEGGGRTFNATIKEVNNNLVTVYTEELGERLVTLWSLRPPSDESSWSTVGSRDKKLSNGHGDWEERGKGRGRTKSTPAAAAASQAAAPGSGGRVQKQHSWPQQATVEEQGGAKPSRKSTSESVSFGLTEEERLAKEEEERNVALVEIQLRDELSFPALGAQTGMQGDGGKRKGGEKRRSQRSKMKSPVEDVRAASPAGERPKSSTPPLVAIAVPPADAPTPTNPTPPAAAPSADSGPAQPSPVKASTPTNVSATAPGSASGLPPACAAPADKTNAPSCASAVGAPPLSPPAAPLATKPPATGGAAPQSVPSSASVFSFVTPVLPAASPALSSSSSSIPPPSSSVPPPTFIAPIAPSPAAVQGFLPPSSFSRSSPPVSSLPHSPSPPPSVIHHAAKVQEAPPAPAQTSNSGDPLSAPQTFQSLSSLARSPACVSQAENPTPPCLAETQSQASVPQTTFLKPQMQTEVLSSVQHQPQAPLPQPQSQVQYPLQPQFELAHLHLQVQSSHPPPGASYPQPHQPHLHSQLVQPPHPSQVPHPSLSLSASLTHPSLPTEAPQSKPEAPPPAAQQPRPRPESPALPTTQQSHAVHPLLPPPRPQPLPGAVPLQQLSQLFQDPLYPGFPQGEKGDMVPTPAFSSSKSGDDLPQDVNVLRFFFNLGVKAYSVPMFPPCMYLIPLQQAFTIHPKLPSRSPSPTPHFTPSNPPARHQETYPQFPPTSVPLPAQYDHQTPLAEPPRPAEPSFSQAGYPVAQPPPHRMPSPSVPWQQHQMPPPRNCSFQVAYSSPTPPYTVAMASPQGYHSGQGPAPPLYPSAVPSYPPSSLGFHPPSNPEQFQGSQGAAAQLQPANGEAIPGHGLGRVPGPLEVPAAADVANANNNRTVLVHAFKKEQGESVLLVDPPLNDTPIHIPMTTLKPSGPSASHDNAPKPGVSVDGGRYRGPRKLYVKPGALEPGVSAAEGLSVACSTEDDWEEPEGFGSSQLNFRGQRKNYRGRGRGGYRRRPVGDGGRFSHPHGSYRGPGLDRLY